MRLYLALMKISVLLYFSAEPFELHGLPVLLLNYGLQLLLLLILLVPHLVSFFELRFDEQNVLLLLLNGLAHYFLLVFVVDYRLLILVEPVLQFFFFHS